MKINWFKILVYISIGFLIFVLIKGNYLRMPNSLDWHNFIISLFFMFLSFVLLSTRWYLILKEQTMKISYRDSLASIGLSIFAKYIPGKLLMIIGKTRYIRDRYPYKEAILINASFQDQFFAIWTGLLVGSISLVAIKNQYILIMSIIVWVIMALFLFFPKIYKLINSLISKIFKKDINLQAINYKTTIKLLGIHFLYWVFLGIGFLFLFNSISDEVGILTHIFIFPLSVSIGVISFFSPGGIGIRELVLSTYFSNINVDIQLAVSISAFSRLWFLAGEAFIFTLGVLSSKKRKIKFK